MNNTQNDETKNEKISEKWGAFAKRMREKFWIDPETKLATETDKVVELLSKTGN